MQSKMHLLMLALLLAGCATDRSSAALDKADKLIVPAVKEYTPAQQKQAAAEMDKSCAIVPMICQLVSDYGVMRDQARAALGINVDTRRYLSGE